jgi:hypothetical protein
MKILINNEHCRAHYNEVVWLSKCRVTKSTYALQSCSVFELHVIIKRSYC